MRKSWGNPWENPIILYVYHHLYIFIQGKVMESTENPMFTIAYNCFLQFFQLYKPSPGAGQEPQSFCPE